MLRRMGAAFCGVAIIFACVVPTNAAVHPRHLSHGTKARSDIAAPPPFFGAASTYNPLRPGYASGGKWTASGDKYSESSWTAAIQTGLRKFFGGVFSGKAYRPSFAL